MWKSCKSSLFVFSVLLDVGFCILVSTLKTFIERFRKPSIDIIQNLGDNLSDIPEQWPKRCTCRVIVLLPDRDLPCTQTPDTDRTYLVHVLSRQMRMVMLTPRRAMTPRRSPRTDPPPSWPVWALSRLLLHSSSCKPATCHTPRLLVVPSAR